MIARVLPEGLPQHPAIDQLLDRCYQADIGATLAVIAEFQGLEGDPSKLMTGGMRRLVSQELWETFEDVDEIRGHDGLPERVDRTRVRMELIAYLQFWESHLVQRWITGLVDIAAGKPLDPMRDDPPIAAKSRPGTQEIWDRTRALARKTVPRLDELSTFIETRYLPQLRNAIGHSQVLSIGNVLVLDNHRPHVPGSRPSMPREEWEHWYSGVRDFAYALVTQTGQLQRECAGEWREFEYVANGVVQRDYIGTDDRGTWKVAAHPLQ